MIEAPRRIIYSCFLFFTLLATANAQPELDITFNGSGKVITIFGGAATAYQPLIQADNKIIAVGVWNSLAGATYFALTRYNSDGSADTSFGNQGIVLTDFHVTSNSIGVAFAGALQPDGKIIAAGYVSIINPGNSYYAMARYNTDGSLDTSFGSDGTVLTQITASQHEARAIAIAPDGKIVLAGSFLSTQTTQTLIVRYNPDGSRDTSFGANGMVTDFRGSTPSDANIAYAVAVQPDGKIITGGSYGRTVSLSGYDITFARYNANGAPDSIFGNQGKVLLQSPNVSEGISAIAVQDDGRILGAGFSGTDFLVMRLFENGQWDTSFNAIGRITVPMGGSFGALAMQLRPNGKILVTGPAAYPNGFSLLSFNTNGTLDTSFSGDGKLTFGFDTGAASYGIALDSLGRPVLSGLAGSGFGVARLYTLDPVPVTVSGRTLTQAGLPIGGVKVSLTDPSGQSRTAITSNFGYFTFDNVPTGQTYTLFVRSSKRYIFESRDFGLNEATNDLDLIGEPRMEPTKPILIDKAGTEGRSRTDMGVKPARF